MKINLYVVNNCPSCIRVQSQLSTFVSKRKGISFTVTSINSNNENSVAIVPATYVNEELFAYGDFEDKRLDVFINRLEEAGM